MKRSYFFLVLLYNASASVTLPLNHTNQSITWFQCPTEALLQANVTCGTLSVPLSYDEDASSSSSCNTARVNLTLVRHAARVPEKRIGNLFYNPGGPGDAVTASFSNITNPTGPEQGIHGDILDRFDIIGVDLRGSGVSTPVKCNRTLYNDLIPLSYPNTKKAFELQKGRIQAFRQSCIDMSGPLVDHMDTKTIAQDHESIRQALGGDEPLNWLGQSGGTQLGAQYAELLPDKIRAMILDSVFWSSGSDVADLMLSAVSQEAVIRSFFDWCKDQEINVTGCSIAGHNRSVEAVWTQLLGRAESKAIPAESCSDGTLSCYRSSFDADDIRQITYQAFYKPFQPNTNNFTTLAYAIEEAAFKNDASIFASMMLPYPAGELDYYTSQGYAERIITCSDRAQNDTSTYWSLKKIITETQTPLMRGYSPELGFAIGCIGWPKSTRNPPHRFNASSIAKLPTILLVGNLIDPATSYSAALQLQEQIGDDKAVLVARTATGHTVYFVNKAHDGETIAAMNKYLLDLELPAQATVFSN